MGNFEPDPNIEGIWTRKINSFFDSRGNFREILRKCDLPSEVPELLQDSISYSTKNVLRGLHFQEKQWQLITLIKGSIQDILMCVDENSERYLKPSMRLMGEDGVNQILTAPGFAHGYACLGDETIIHYSSSVYFGETPQHGINWQSKCVRDLWEERNWITSERDSRFPMAEFR